jgi:uncharacterized membrane protein
MNKHKTGYDHIAGQKVGRIEALADGVFAVAITLLVLDIKAPLSDAIKSEGELWGFFTALMPRLLTYFMSFMTLGIFWMGHSTQFRFIERSDRNLNWITLFFLMVICLLPFTTAFLADYMRFRFAIGLYWGNVMLCGLALFIHWNYAYRHNYLQVSAEEKERIHVAMNRRVIIAQILYLVGALLCFIDNRLSIGFILLVQLNYALGLVTRRFRM